MEEHLQKADRVQVYVGSKRGLVEMSAGMKTTRIHNSLVFLNGGGNGVAGTRGRGKVWVWRVCFAPLCLAARAVGNAFIVLQECGRQF